MGKKNNKIAVNRHQTQSKASAGAQERAIERVTRQASAKLIREEAARCTDCDDPFTTSGPGAESQASPGICSFCYCGS